MMRATMPNRAKLVAQEAGNASLTPKAEIFGRGFPLGFNGGDTNLYRYVGDDPTNFADPSGLWKKGGGEGPGVQAYWKSNTGQYLAKRLDDAEKYLKETIDSLLKDLDTLEMPDGDKQVLRELLREIKKRVETLEIWPVLDLKDRGRDAVRGSQALPYGGNGMYLSVYNVINVRSKDGLDYYKNDDKDLKYVVSPYLLLREDYKTDEYVIYDLSGQPKDPGEEDEIGLIMDTMLLPKYQIQPKTEKNKDLPKPSVTLWEPNQFAALMSNEILHHLSDDKVVRGWQYSTQRNVPTSKTYSMLALHREAGSFRPIEYALWDFDKSIGKFDKDKPTFEKLVTSDAIFQAIAYNKWPSIAK